MKKKKPELVEWEDLKVGDFIESPYSRMFCFKVDNGSPSCCGRRKLLSGENYDGYNYVGSGIVKYTRIKPTKSFIKLCKQLLDLNLKENHLDNLSYIEALAALKRYD